MSVSLLGQHFNRKLMIQHLLCTIRHNLLDNSLGDSLQQKSAMAQCLRESYPVKSVKMMTPRAKMSTPKP